MHSFDNRNYQESLTSSFNPIMNDNIFQSNSPSFTVLEWIDKQKELYKLNCTLPSLPWWSYCWNWILTCVVLFVFGMRPGVGASSLSLSSSSKQNDTISFLINLFISGFSLYWILAISDY